MTIVVFMNNGVTKDQINETEEKIKKMSNVDKYTFESKIEVKKQMQAESDVFKTVLDNWDDDESPLKDTFQVK